jgi:hypothetical protein
MIDDAHIGSMIAKKFLTCRSIACLEDGRDSSVLQNAAASLKYDRVVIDYENALSSRPLRILFACAFTVTWHEVGMSALCRFSNAGDDDRLRTLKRPAFEKRQGRKSRSVVRRRFGWLYGDLAAA